MGPISPAYPESNSVDISQCLGLCTQHTIYQQFMVWFLPVHQLQCIYTFTNPQQRGVCMDPNERVHFVSLMGELTI